MRDVVETRVLRAGAGRECGQESSASSSSLFSPSLSLEPADQGRDSVLLHKDPWWEHGVKEFSQVWGWGWGRGVRAVELGTQLSLQAAAPLRGLGSSWANPQGPSTSFAGLFVFPGLEALHTKTAPSCSTYLMSTGQDGRVGPALAMLGAYQRIQGWSVGGAACPAGEGTRAVRLSTPSAKVGLGSCPSAVTISTSFCCVLYMDIFISCLIMLCSCGLSTSEETVF